MTDPANQALLDSWRLSLHNKQPRTIALYLTEAARFAAWRGGDLLAVTRQDVEAWIGEQQAAGLSKSTIRSRWIALRSLFGWLVDEDELDDSPIAKVRVPNRTRRHPTCWTPASSAPCSAPVTAARSRTGATPR